MVLITKKLVTSSKHGMNLWSEFQPCSRVMFQISKYDFGFGFIVEAPDKVHNKNRFLIMSDEGIIKYIPKQNVSLLKYLTCLSDFEESLERFYDERTTENNQFRIERILKFYKYLFSIKKRKHPIIPVIADTRIKDDLIALNIDGRKTLGMIRDLDGSMVNVQLIETDITFWIYSGDPIFIENEQFISANLKIKFDSVPMEFLRECSTSEVNYIITCQPTLRKRSYDKSQKKKRGKTHSTHFFTEDELVELPDLEEIYSQQFSSTDSEKESEDSSRLQSRIQYDSPSNSSIDFPPDSTNHILNDSIINVSEQNSTDVDYEFTLDPPLSPSEWKRIRTEQTLKNIEIILPVPQFQDY